MPREIKNESIVKKCGRKPVVDKEKLAYYVKAGLQDKEIAIIFNVSRVTIVKARKRFEIESVQRREVTKINVGSLVNFVKLGWTDAQIALFFSVTRQAVHETRKRLGIRTTRQQGERGPDKAVRQRKELHNGDPCPTSLFGTWPDSSGWPVGPDGNKLWLIGWSSVPPGRHILDCNFVSGGGKCSPSRESVAAAWRCHEEWRTRLVNDNGIDSMVLECMDEDQQLRGKRDTSGLGRGGLENVQFRNNGARRNGTTRTL